MKNLAQVLVGVSVGMIVMLGVWASKTPVKSNSQAVSILTACGNIQSLDGVFIYTPFADEELSTLEYEALTKLSYEYETVLVQFRVQNEQVAELYAWREYAEANHISIEQRDAAMFRIKN